MNAALYTPPNVAVCCSTFSIFLNLMSLSLERMEAFGLLEDIVPQGLMCKLLNVTVCFTCALEHSTQPGVTKGGVAPDKFPIFPSSLWLASSFIRLNMALIQLAVMGLPPYTLSKCFGKYIINYAHLSTTTNATPPTHPTS